MDNCLFLKDSSYLMTTLYCNLTLPNNKIQTRCLTWFKWYHLLAKRCWALSTELNMTLIKLFILYLSVINFSICSNSNSQKSYRQLFQQRSFNDAKLGNQESTVPLKSCGMYRPVYFYLFAWNFTGIVQISFEDFGKSCPKLPQNLKNMFLK